MGKNEIILSLRNIKKQLGSFTLGPLNLDIHKNDYLILLGPTGAGKTVLLQLICGNILPDEGDILLEERLITRNPPERRDIGIVYQDYLLFPHLSVENNIRFSKSYYLKIYRNKEEEYEERYKYLIGVLDIRHLMQRSPRYLSGGEQQRVALARSLVIAPKIILLDEPLSAVDNSLHEKIMNVLSKITRDLDLTTIHITHNKEEAFYLGNKIVLLNNGKIEQKGTPIEILKRPSNRFVANFLGRRNLFEGKLILYPEKNEINLKVKDYEFVLHWNLTGLRNDINKTTHDILISIPAEDIVLSKNKNDRYQYNIKGVIERCQTRVSMVVVNVKTEIGVNIDVITSHQEIRSLGADVKKEVFVCFNKENVHVVNLSFRQRSSAKEIYTL